MAFLDELKNFDSKELENVDTVVKTIGFVVDTSPDFELHKVVEGVFISSGDGAANLEELKKHGITHIINLAPAVVDNYFEGKFMYKSCEALDVPEFDLLALFDECLEFIGECLEQKETTGNCLIHCNAGVSRSSTIVIAFLIKQHNMSYEDAYKLVKEARPQIQPNPGFVKQLKDFEKICKENKK